MLLLHAALEDDPKAAHHCFARWRREIERGPGCVDYASGRLLPRVYRNLARGSAAFPHAQQLRGLYRLSWKHGQDIQRGSVQAIGLLLEHGIAVLVSKGVALMHDYYGSIGERPINDCDIYVPEGDLERAGELLRTSGWKQERIFFADFSQRERATLAFGQCYRHPVYGEVDLHGRIVKDWSSADIERGIWQRAEAMRMGPVEVRRPCATHLLFHVLAHGVRPDHYPALRWVTDVVLMLRKAPEKIDWEEFWRMAREAKVASRVGAGLSLVRDEFGVPVEVPSFAAFSPLELLESRVYNRTPSFDTGMRSMLYEIAERMRRLSQRSWRQRGLSVLRFARQRFGRSRADDHPGMAD